MRVLVVGAGVIGVTTAHELAGRGHKVEVLDGASGPGLGATGVNAGLLVPADALPWSNPSAPGTMVAALAGRGRFLKVRRGAGRDLLPWGLEFLRQCAPGRSRANAAALHALCAFSCDELERVLAAEGIDATHRRNGVVLLFGDEQGRARWAAARRVLAERGEPYEELTPADLVTLDPAYARAARRLAGAILAPRCGHADCGAFTRALTQRSIARGVTFRYGTPAQRLMLAQDRVVGVMTSAGPVSADVTVLACGAWTARLARTVGVRLAITPAKGYALTVPVRTPRQLPRIGGIDEDAHVAFSPMGERMRITSTAEFAGFDMRMRPQDFTALRTAAVAMFGDAVDVEAAVPSTGLRPCTPSGQPIIGLARAGLAVNSGHGHLGWTGAAGSARLLADAIDGSRPPIDPDPFRPRRA